MMTFIFEENIVTAGLCFLDGFDMYAFTCQAALLVFRMEFT